MSSSVLDGGQRVETIHPRFATTHTFFGLSKSGELPALTLGKLSIKGVQTNDVLSFSSFTVQKSSSKMFRCSSFILLSVIAKLALALNQGDLTVSLKTVESSVKTVDNIVITAVVSNPTNKDLRVLSAHNILDASATQSFDVKAANGKEVPFTGIKVRWTVSIRAMTY